MAPATANASAMSIAIRGSSSATSTSAPPRVVRTCITAPRRRLLWFSSLRVTHALRFVSQQMALSTAGAQGQEGCGSLVGRRELAIGDSADALLTECSLPHQHFQERRQPVACFRRKATAKSLRAPAFRTSGPGAHFLRRTELKPYVSPIERAFALAQTGRFTTVSEIRQRLRDEGYFK
jgi:hypothetical protein